MARDVNLQTTLLALLLLAGLATDCAAGTLGQFREDVRTPAPAEEDPPPKKQDKAKEKQPASSNNSNWWSSTDDCHTDDDSSTDITGTFAIVGVVATSPFWAPIALCGDDPIIAGYFAPYPYEGTSGSMVFDHGTTGEIPPAGYVWAIKVRGEYGDDFDSLTRYSGHVLVEHSNRWGFDSETNYWREALAGGGHDELWTGDANLLFRFAQSERAQFRAGLGANWLSDNVGTELGFNFTYSADFYPAKPLVLSSELDAGWLGEAWLIHLRTTIGVQWRQVEVYTGYDYREIGSTQLDGWISGVRVLF